MRTAKSGFRNATRVLIMTEVVIATMLLISIGSAVGRPTPAAAWDFQANEIAQHARNHPKGEHGGQCKVFAEDVVNEVLRAHSIKARVRGYGTPGGAYYGAYERAGGVLVDADEGRVGDLIQVITPEKKNSDSPPTRDEKDDSILHTAIIVERTPDVGRYIVRDSNYVAHETVGEHSWTPTTWRKRGVEVYVWRFGEVAALENKPIEADGKVLPTLTSAALGGTLQPVLTSDLIQHLFTSTLT